MTDPADLISELSEGRRRFLALIAGLRPELHRYCARMTGSIAEGEDVVQDTLARAYYALSELTELPQLRPWLFRIAHRRAIDYLRRYDRRMGQPLEVVEDTAADPALDPEDALARDEAVRAAVSRFVALAPAQRSCVILKDVLGHSLEEIAALTELSVPAVKAALHRGRVRLRELCLSPAAIDASRPASPAVVRYAALFNARDWDGVRAMLAEDVQLDLVSRAQRSGREVGTYFVNYARLDNWYLVPAWLDGSEVLAVFADARAERPRYFIELEFADRGIVMIRDWHFVPYIVDEAVFVPAASSAQ